MSTVLKTVAALALLAGTSLLCVAPARAQVLPIG